MNWKKYFGYILCFVMVFPLAFFVLCTVLTVVDPESRIALIFFIPVDLAFVGLFLLGIRLIRRNKKPKAVKNYYSDAYPVKQRTVRCPECGASFRSNEKKCTFCGRKLQYTGQSQLKGRAL